MRNFKNWMPLFLLFFGSTLQAQTGWTLEKCINQAVLANIQVKQGELGLQSQAYHLKSSKASALPSLNGNVIHGYNWGQALDPFTNQFATSRVQSNNFNVGASVTLFQGLQTLNLIRRNQSNYNAGKADVEATKNQVRLAVAATFLAILFQEELVANAQNQVNISQQQVARIEKLVEVGQMARGSLLDMEAQLASDELNLVNQNNQLTMRHLEMVQLLMLPSEQSNGFKVVKPELAEINETLLSATAHDIYKAALGTMPEIQGQEYRISGAEHALSMAKGGYSPSLRLNGSYGTGYSGLQTRPTGVVNFLGYDTSGFTAVNNEAVLTPRYGFETENTPFGAQLKNNTNTSLTFSLNIPIFNGFRVRNNIQQAQIDLAGAQLNMASAQNSLRTSINQSYADALAARKRFIAAEKSAKAMEESFKYAQVRYNEQMINTVEYNDTKNKRSNAKSELIQAKYDYIFKTRILDFYQGKPFQL